MNAKTPAATSAAVRAFPLNECKRRNSRFVFSCRDYCQATPNKVKLFTQKTDADAKGCLPHLEGVRAVGAQIFGTRQRVSLHPEKDLLVHTKATTDMVKHKLVFPSLAFVSLVCGLISRRTSLRPLHFAVR
jgi:hypothetical protein